MDAVTLALAKKYTDEHGGGGGPGPTGPPGPQGPAGKTPILSIDDRGHLLVSYTESGGEE